MCPFQQAATIAATKLEAAEAALIEARKTGTPDELRAAFTARLDAADRYDAARRQADAMA